MEFPSASPRNGKNLYDVVDDMDADDAIPNLGAIVAAFHNILHLFGNALLRAQDNYAVRNRPTFHRAGLPNHRVMKMKIVKPDGFDVSSILCHLRSTGHRHGSFGCLPVKRFVRTRD